MFTSGSIPIFPFGDFTGCFYNSGDNGSYNTYLTDNDKINRSTDNKLRFDASRSNNIYGKAQKVQPKAYQALIIIKS